LDTAVTIIKSGGSTWNLPPATVDVMFKGDMTKWAKLANTMNLRLLLHQSEVGGAKATFISGEIAKIAANGAGFLGTGEDAQINPGYQKATALQNPFWESNGLGVGGDLGDRGYNRASDYGVTWFKSHNDPRLSRVFRDVNSAPGANANLVYKGIPFGADPTNSLVTQVTSGFGIGVMGDPGQSLTFLSAAESFFLQAEAAHRGWIAGSESTLYTSGITESFRLLGATGLATYLAQASVTFPAPGTTAALKAIMVQKWAAEYVIDPMEAWTDLRRLGYPDDLPQSQNTSKINPTPPIRLFYPQTEYSNNSGAVKQQEDKEGLTGNYQFSKTIFWDVAP
jgi:Starch-binding associating with outer membrane